MTRFIKTLITFILFSSGLYVVLLCGWGELLPLGSVTNLDYKLGGYGHMHTRVTQVRDYGKVDALVLGSSHAYRGFDPRIFEEHGIRIFNLGSSAQTPLQTKVLVGRYMESLDPDLVLYVVGPSAFASDGVESSLDILANDRLDWAAIEMAARQNHLRVYHTLVYSEYRRILHRDSAFAEPTTKGDDTYISGGYVEKQLRRNVETNELAHVKLQLATSQMRAFEWIVSHCQAAGVSLVLVQAPATRAYYESVSDHAEFDAVMRSHGIYLDFGRTLPLDDEIHFYDSHHLNQDGVRIFDEAVIGFLRAQGHLEYSQ